jgi:ATP-binding cassette, subfamily G (WHITE), member 2, SNQ2
MVYFGPIRLARQYFIDMGYVPANRQTTADFLVSVTDPCGRTMIAMEDDKRDHPIPQTALEFEEYFKNSEIMKMNLEDIRSYKAANVDKPDRTVAYKESAKAEHARHTRATVSKSNFQSCLLFDRFFFKQKSPYTISIPMQVQIVMLRRIQIIRGNCTAQALTTM